jgi:hypothetical protein
MAHLFKNNQIIESYRPLYFEMQEKYIFFVLPLVHYYLSNTCIKFSQDFSKNKDPFQKT